MYRRTWELLGASPEPMAFAEVFTSLQQGIIDGQENPLEVVADQRLDEVQDYVMHTDHVIGAVTFIFDSGRFGNFSPELQEILQEEGDAAMRRGTERMIEQEAHPGPEACVSAPLSSVQLRAMAPRSSLMRNTTCI